MIPGIVTPLKRTVNCHRSVDTLQIATLFLLQLFDTESSTYTYLLGDTLTGEALLIDPVLEQTKRDFQLIKDLNLKLKYASKRKRVFKLCIICFKTRRRGW